MTVARDEILPPGVAGVMHIGANHGQERDYYERQGLPVLWIEAIPSVYESLCRNIEGYPNQRAIQALLTDRDGDEHEFFIASNEGASSSIYDLGLHTDIWPEVSYVGSEQITSTRLDTLLAREGIRAGDYPALVMDVQGAELLVLKGAGRLIDQFQVVKAEAADFESYAGGCRLADLQQFLSAHGFREVKRDLFAEHEDGGHYWDVWWQRKPPWRRWIDRLSS